jgi:hypothetical protein
METAEIRSAHDRADRVGVAPIALLPAMKTARSGSRHLLHGWSKEFRSNRFIRLYFPYCIREEVGVSLAKSIAQEVSAFQLSAQGLESKLTKERFGSGPAR